MRNLTLIAALSACLVYGLPATCRAGLGATVDTVQADGVRMKATARRVVGYSGYDVHQLTLPSGTLVREYVNSAGTVFGVAWQGPFKPNLSQLLGASYPRIVAAAQVAHPSHRMLAVHASDLVVNSGGKMGNFSGRAYLPALLPAALTAGDIL